MAGDLPDAKSVAVEQTDGVGNSLPDPIILHILSFLPMAHAARAAMALGLQDFWTCLRDISIDECDWHVCSDTTWGRSLGDIDNFVKFHNRVLALHDSPDIDRFLLKVDVDVRDQGVDFFRHCVCSKAGRSLAKAIDGWINFALRKMVKTLDLDFLGCRRYRQYCFILKGLPVSISGSHLVELRLTSCDVRKVRFESLRKLSLTSILDLRQQTMAAIFSGCPNLEELSICGDMGLTCLKVPKQHPLKKLCVKLDCLETLDLGCSKVEELILVASSSFETLNCPNVTDLDLSGHIHHVCLEDAGSVNDTSIHLEITSGRWTHPFCLYHVRRDSCKRIVEEEFLNLKLLLEKLRHCSRFELCTWIFSVLSIWEIRERPSLSYDWKHVTALLGLTKWIKPGLRRLLRHCECLETLAVYFYPCCDDKLKFFEEKMQEAYGFDQGGSCESLSLGSYGCLQRHLRKVRVQGFVTDPLSIQFIVFLLGNALNLEELVISARKTPEESEDRYLLLADEIRLKKEGRTHDLSPQFRRQILELPRASSSAVISFT